MTNIHIIGGHDSLSRLDKITYCINCQDEISGAVGTFAYDEPLFLADLGHFAISPVFITVDEFYAWSKENGFLYHSMEQSFVMQRDFPVKKV